MYEPDQPLTELVERSWKLLYRHGSKMRDHKHNDLMRFQLDDWVINSVNRLLFLRKIRDHNLVLSNIVLSVDEGGEIGSLDVVECALALGHFRQYTILEDLAEVADG
jgi:hypothetical protein